MANTVSELIEEINSNRSQRASSYRDECRIMMAMLNDTDFSVDIYSKEGVVGTYCPAEDVRGMISNIIRSATKMTVKEANHLADQYQFTKQDSRVLVDLSKEFINTYIETGRKLPLGGRKDSNIALSKKVKEERNKNFPKKVGTNDDGSVCYEACNEGTIPTHGSIRVHSSCPPWLRNNE